MASWYDYGAFCMRVGDASKAEECFRETVALDQQNENALILLGVLAMAEEHYAEVILKSSLRCCTRHID